MSILIDWFLAVFYGGAGVWIAGAVAYHTWTWAAGKWRARRDRRRMDRAWRELKSRYGNPTRETEITIP